ncbi:MAG: CdaR family protein [Candidatus Binataceae bacterium]
MPSPNRTTLKVGRAARGLLTSDNGLRILSLLLAIGLWVFVNAGERDAMVTLKVPISYRSLPPSMLIVNRPPDFVNLEVMGPRMLLSLLEPEQLTLKLNLTGVTMGQSEFKIYPSMFDVKRATVTRISPDQITLDIDREIGRVLPVHLTIEGKVAEGYRIVSVATEPSNVTVTGPSRDVSRLMQAPTEPFDVSKLAADAQHLVGLLPPEGSARYSVAQVEARVKIAPKIAEREFHQVAVQVRNSGYKYRLKPQLASVTIRGPENQLATVNPKGLLYVNADGIKPGSHELPLMVNLPAGMKLVRELPDRIKFRAYHQRIKAGSDGRAS